jgi:hypothetical protein
VLVFVLVSLCVEMADELELTPTAMVGLKALASDFHGLTKKSIATHASKELD